jgi:hypothetical protein
MAKYIPTRNFLAKQVRQESGKRKDVNAKKGELIELSDEEAIKFWGSLKLNDDQKKKLNRIAKTEKLTRLV